MNSHSAWRASVEAELKGRSFESALVKKTYDGLSIEPLYEPRPTSLPIPPRASAPRTGPVLEAGAAAPGGPSLAWWIGAPGALSDSTRFLIVEGAAAPPGVESIVIGAEGARSASPAALQAAEKGAGAIAELASAFVALARSLDEGAAPTSLAVALSLGTDFFVEVAKLRAARQGIAGILAAAGAEARSLPIVARQTRRSLATIDVETNALRSTLAGAAGLIGGATHIALFAHDAALASASASHDLAARLSWTQGEVLVRESHLDLFGDAALGAPLIEALTDQIGAGAWALAQAALAGDDAALASRIEVDAKARAHALSTRKRPLVGVSRFVGHVEGVGDPGRDASPFEALRRHGAGTVAAVVALGDRKIEPRVDFAREVLELAGFEVKAPARAEDLTSALSSVDPAATVAILAMADAGFATDGVALAAALTERGLRVLLAGKPGEAEAALRDAGVRAFVYQGADLVEVLSSLDRSAA